MKRLGLVAMMSMVAMAASSACSKKATKGPPQPKAHDVTKKPAGAMDKGKVSTKVTPPKAPASAPKISTLQANDDGDEEFAWQEDVDGDGTLDDVIEVLDDETGDVVFASSWSAPCDDGTALSAALFVTQHADGTGTFLFASDDLCGEGAAMYGCDFDKDGNSTVCGACAVPADGTEFTCEDTSPASE